MTYSRKAAAHGSVPAMVIISAKSCKIPFKISSRHEDFRQTALMPVSAVFFTLNKKPRVLRGLIDRNEKPLRCFFVVYRS